jgi:hypothetical protein
MKPAGRAALSSQTRHFAVVERELFMGSWTVADAVVPAGRGAVCAFLAELATSSVCFVTDSEAVR